MSQSSRFIVVSAFCFIVLAGAPLAYASTGIQPTKLDIPAINLAIPVISVGLTPTGAMDVPHNFVQAGWYDQGVVPGNVGSAVIDGHVDNGGYSPTIAGVFKHLEKVKPDDVIQVSLSDGSHVSFKVISSVVYNLATFPDDKVFNQTGAAYLKIITCHGMWDPAIGTSSQRLVVTAVRV